MLRTAATACVLASLLVACISTVDVEGNGDGGSVSKTAGDGGTTTTTTPGDDASTTTTTNADGSTASGDDSSTSTTTAGDDSGSGDDDATTGPAPTIYSGQATYYTANGEGACGNSISDSDDVAAINSDQYSSANCGKCAKVTGPNGSVTVRIEDKCPGCNSDSLDLSTTAFDSIADMSAGRVSITWYFTACN